MAARFAEHTGDAELSALADRVDAALKVAVLGRPGVGRGTVEAALSGRGVVAVADPGAAELIAA